MKYTFFTLLFTFCSIALFAQSESLYEIGVETQVYPTGVIPGVRFAFLPDSKNEYTLRVGYQFIDHRDLGKHLDETGSGFGGSIGYRRFLKDNSKGFAIGARVDVWKNTIDWEDEVRIFLEERTNFSPDAMTGMEANLRFAGPETMETRIFGRLTAWQNWIFQRPNAVGEKGALPLYGSGQRKEYDRRRV